MGDLGGFPGESEFHEHGLRGEIRAGGDILGSHQDKMITKSVGANIE